MEWMDTCRSPYTNAQLHEAKSSHLQLKFDNSVVRMRFILDPVTIYRCKYVPLYFTATAWIRNPNIICLREYFVIVVPPYNPELSKPLWNQRYMSLKSLVCWLRIVLITVLEIALVTFYCRILESTLLLLLLFKRK